MGERNVRFVRIRGRIVPIRKRVSEGLESISSVGAVASGLSIATARGIENKKFGKIRANLIKRTHFKPRVGKPLRKAFLTPFKLRKVGLKVGKVSALLGIASFVIAPDKQLADVANLINTGE